MLPTTSMDTKRLPLSFWIRPGRKKSSGIHRFTERTSDENGRTGNAFNENPLFLGRNENAGSCRRNGSTGTDRWNNDTVEEMKLWLLKRKTDPTVEFSGSYCRCCICLTDERRKPTRTIWGDVRIVIIANEVLETGLSIKTTVPGLGISNVRLHRRIVDM